MSKAKSKGEPRRDVAADDACSYIFPVGVGRIRVYTTGGMLCLIGDAGDARAVLQIEPLAGNCVFIQLKGRGRQ